MYRYPAGWSDVTSTGTLREVGIVAPLAAGEAGLPGSARQCDRLDASRITVQYLGMCCC